MNSDKISLSEIEISLCIIAKDEEMVIQRAIISAKPFIDEIILIDTGSSDKTKEIGKRLGAKIYDFEWCNDFSKVRNFAFTKATKEYIFWMDADDYITPENAKIIRDIKKKLAFKNIDVVSMIYSLSLNKDGNINSSLRRNRIIKRNNNYIWIGRIHEYLQVWGKVFYSNAVIHHGKIKDVSDRNLQYFNKMIDNNEEFSLREIFYYGNELFDHRLYDEAIIQYNIFLDTKKGWKEDVKTATANLVECYKNLGKKENLKLYLLKSFQYDTPRADICCKLGDCFFEDKEYKNAIFWYKIARECIHEKDNVGYDLKDYYTWIPTLQLCLCYCLLEDYETAYYYNEITAIYNPKLKEVENNRIYLQDKLEEFNKDIPKFKIKLEK